jgi:hypothetical protein
MDCRPQHQRVTNQKRGRSAAATHANISLLEMFTVSLLEMPILSLLEMSILSLLEMFIESLLEMSIVSLFKMFIVSLLKLLNVTRCTDLWSRRFLLRAILTCVPDVFCYALH